MKTIRDLKIGDIFEDGIVYNIEDNAIEIVSIMCRLLYRNQIDISDIWQIPTISDFNKLLSKKSDFSNRTYTVLLLFEIRNSISSLKYLRSIFLNL